MTPYISSFTYTLSYPFTNRSNLSLPISLSHNPPNLLSLQGKPSPIASTNNTQPPSASAAIGNGGNASGSAVSGSRVVVPRGVLLWGELERGGDKGASTGVSEGVSDVKGDKDNDDDDDELSTAVEVALCIDTKAKTYTLTVTGLGPLALVRWRRLQQVVQDAMLYRRHSIQLPSWMPYHREAMATSDVLKGAPPSLSFITCTPAL